jgi:hypothetical protein
MHSKVEAKSESESKSQRVDAALKFMEKHKDMSARKTAEIFQISPSSISKRLLGQHKSLEERATERQSLTPTEEATLTKWALQYHAWGLPLQITQLKQFAFEILLKKKISNPQIGINRHLGFLKRNPQLEAKLSSPLDRKRMSAYTPENIQSFFDLFEQITTEHQIKPENM